MITKHFNSIQQRGKGSDRVEVRQYAPPAPEQDGTISAVVGRSSVQWLPAMAEVMATHAVAAVGSVAFASTLVYPLDTLKTLVQIGAGPTQQLGIMQILDKVRTPSGNLGLYSGFGWSTLARISGLGARFGVYELLTAFYKDGREDDYVYVSEALLAGLAAGTMEALVCTPFELLKVRAQVASASHLPASTPLPKQLHNAAPSFSKLFHGYSPNPTAWDRTLSLLSVLPGKQPDLAAFKEYPWMMTGSGRPPFAYEVRGLSNITSLEGLGVLLRGLRAGIVRDSVFGGFFFSTWQFLHIAMLNWKAIQMEDQPRSVVDIGPVSPLGAGVAAGFSGAFAAAASHCFDTAKTRSQAVVVPKYTAMERKFLRWKPRGLWYENFAGIPPSDRKFLFRGLLPRMARSGVASSLLVGVYFLAVDHLI